jgi:hypothetical protein
LPSRRDRALVALAGVMPDADGLGLLLYPWDGGAAYGQWHHLVGHTIFAAVGTALLCAAVGVSRARTALLGFFAFHLHLLCDLLGSGAGWPIAYLWPASDRWVQPFSFGWELSSWQNGVIGTLATLACFATALPLGRTLFEVLSAKLDATAVQLVRRLSSD